MKTINTILKTSLIFTAISSSSPSFGFDQALEAACFNGANPNIKHDETITTGIGVDNTTFINCGKILHKFIEGSELVVGTNGVFENYGILESETNTHIPGGSNGKIINHLGGIINVSYYLDLYGGEVINEGTLNFNRRIGDGYAGLEWGHAPAYIVMNANTYLTNLENGYIRIDNTVLFDSSIFSWQVITNYGKIEITKNGKLSLVSSFYPDKAIAYKQDGPSSQMIVNGELILTPKGATTGFSALLNGTFKGTGVIKGNYDSDMGFTIAPGDEIGTLTFDTPELALNFGTMLDIEIGGRLANQMKHDVLNVTGNLKLQGTLNIYNHAGFAPQDGQTYTIIKANNITGQFFAINGDNRFGGRWSLQYNPTSVVLVYNAQ